MALLILIGAPRRAWRDMTLLERNRLVLGSENVAAGVPVPNIRRLRYAVLSSRWRTGYGLRCRIPVRRALAGSAIPVGLEPITNGRRW